MIPIIKINHRIKMPDLITYNKMNYLHYEYGVIFDVDFINGKAYAIIEEIINLNEKNRETY